jgi:Putative prokaryotic signal transducing protein
MSSMGFGAAGLVIAIALVLWAMMRPRKAPDGQARLCEIVRTNNTVLISAIEAVLEQAEIPHLVLDQNMSVLEGSLGVLPRRVLVHQRSLAAARALLADAGLGHELIPDAG